MTSEEIRTASVDELEVRANELLATDESLSVEELEARAEESKEIEARMAELKAEARAKAEKCEQVANGELGTEISKIVEERKMSNVEIRNSAEYVNAYAEYIKSGNDTECRALLTENVSGTVAVPDVVEGIVRTAWEREGIMSRVKKSYLKGNLKVGFELSATGAVVHTEGAAAPNEETLVLGTVAITPVSIKKWISISDEVYDLRGEEFLTYIYNELAYQIAKKAADELVGKILTAGTTATSTAVGVPTIKVATPAMDTIVKGLALLADSATEPVVIMNKQTYPVFKALQFASGYGADPFEGLPVIFSSAVTAYSAATTGVAYAIVGDLANGAIANFPNGDEITFKFDDLSLAEKDLIKIVGREFVGLGIVGPDSFATITK